MDISLDELKILAAEKEWNLPMLEKDYLLTKVLYEIKDIEGIFFKGGTALNKIYLDYARLSEDLDFTVTRNINEVEKEIRNSLKETQFSKITEDKRVEGFLRLVIHYKLFHEIGTIFIDLNKRAKSILQPEKKNIPHFYKEYIPNFSILCLNQKEMIAEKVAAAIGRNKPRDHFDIYMILKKNYSIDKDIVTQKCHSSGEEYDIIKMFNNAKKLKNNWDQDMQHLERKGISFQEVMSTLAKHFQLKEEKEKQKTIRELSKKINGDATKKFLEKT